MATLQDVFEAWQHDIQFRETFKKNPELALEQAGFSLSPEDLKKVQALLTLDKSKNEKLDDRISK